MIHQLIFHGKGGYDYNTVYNMPIWLRKFTYSEIKDFYAEEKKSIENAQSGGKGTKNLVNADGKVTLQHLQKQVKHIRVKQVISNNIYNKIFLWRVNK